MIWDEEAIGRLRKFWDQGISTAEIGRRLGVSKNGVVGKAHRLDLEARPSPIRSGGLPYYRPHTAVPRVARPTLPPLVSEAHSQPAVALVYRPAPPPAPARAPTTIAFRPRSSPCCWPIGHPRTSSFRFCDGTALLGKPYCDEHAKLAYVHRGNPAAQHEEALA